MGIDRGGGGTGGIHGSELAGGVFSPETLTAISTYSVANGCYDGSPQNHWHANADGDTPGLELEAAEVGGALEHCAPDGAETCRGIAEFSISGKFAATQALLKVLVLDVFDYSAVEVGGLFGQTTPYQGNIDVIVYEGDGAESVGDFSELAAATIDDAFNTTGASADDEYSVDITTAYNALIASSATAVGIRLQTATESEDIDTAITFYNIRIVLT